MVTVFETVPPLMTNLWLPLASLMVFEALALDGLKVYFFLPSVTVTVLPLRLRLVNLAAPLAATTSIEAVPQFSTDVATETPAAILNSALAASANWVPVVSTTVAVRV